MCRKFKYENTKRNVTTRIQRRIKYLRNKTPKVKQNPESPKIFFDHEISKIRRRVFLKNHSKGKLETYAQDYIELSLDTNVITLLDGNKQV